jgi:DNA repair exonuclease SbcCD ATPase subunit
MANDDVLIVGQLDSKELERSIDALVWYVNESSKDMAEKFDSAMVKMKASMKDFALTQKVSVDLMKDAWRDMSSSFDAMLRAQQEATDEKKGGGGSKTKTKYDDDTVGHLEEVIKLEERRRKEMKLNSDELKLQNEIIEQQKSKLKSQTTREVVKEAKDAKKELDEAFSKPAKNLTDAEKKLQRLQELSTKFQGKGILDAKQWNNLRTQIQNTQIQIDKLRTKQPKTLSQVMGMDESSIDAITQKMAALKRVAIDPKNSEDVKNLGNEYQKLKRRLAELQGANIQATHSNNYLAQSFGYIRNRIVYALTLGALTNFVKQIYEVRSQYELLERSLGVLVGSFERGSQVFQTLNEMALKSPFTLMELAGAAKQLTAYDFAAKDVVDTTRRLADISAALGVPMERLTYNLGQIRAQTVLTARDARDFANAGLPIVSKLAERFTELEGKIVTTGDVYDRMKKKMVSYTDVMAVLNKMTDEGGKFFDFQAKQAETLRVQLANLTLAWNNMLNDLGKSNQSLLSMPVAGLKELLKNWRTFDRLIKSAVISLTIFKTIQLASMATTPVTRFGQALQAALGDKTLAGFGKLGAGLKAIGTQLKALALNPWTWIFTGIMALVDLERQMSAAKDAMHELNQEIRNNAKEASDSMLSFISNKGNQQTLELAKQNKLSAQEGEKAWQSIQEQIEQSALSCNSLIGKLIAIDDINERVATGFEYAKSIQKAQAALQDLKDDTIEVPTDLGWFSMFGEGLVSELKDYGNEVEKFKGTYKDFQDIINTNKGINTDLRITYEEFSKELGKVADRINNYITAYNITDPIQINEILERIKSQIKAKNPEIQGELARIFDVELDKKMSTLTKGAVDENATLWAAFMERLKSHYHHAFEDITNEWVKTGKGLSEAQEKEQKKAVDQNLEYFKDSMPQYYNALKNMVADASKLRIHIGIVFNQQQVSDFQKEVKKRMENTPLLDFGGEAFQPTSNDNLESWVSARHKSIQELQEQNKLYERDNTKWAKQQIKDNDRQIAQQNNLLDLFHQQHEAEKKNKKSGSGRSGGGRKSEDVVAEALRQEIQLIKEMQSNYDKLRKSGVSNMEAIELASKGYELTLMRINNVLQKYGINKFNATDFAGKDVHTLLDSLKRQRDELLVSGKVKTSSLQSLDVEIQKLSIDAKTYDMKKITDGLNNELSKVKDEYELGIELDANPEMGEVFADMMGLSKEELAEMPRDFQGVLRKMQTLINNELGSGKFNLEENLNKSVFESWVNQQGKDVDSEQVKSLKNYVDYANKVRRDETKNQIQEWDKLLEKYSEYEYKMRKIQEDAAHDREIALKKGASSEILDAINRREREQMAQLSFEEYQKSPQWMQATGDLAMLSRKAIGMLIREIEDYKLHARDLSPKQIKQLNNALTRLYKEQRKNNPFHAISDMLAEAKARAKEYQDEIDNVAAEISYLGMKSVTEGLTSDQEERLDSLRETWAKLVEQQKQAGDIDATQWVAAINTTISAVKQGVEVFHDLAKAISGVNTDDVDKVFSVIEKGGEGAAMGAQIGQGYGAIIGAAAGVATGIIQQFSDQWSGNRSITKKIEESERAVKRLELTYIDLEHAMDKAYGTSIVGASRALAVTKELELAEKERQLALEKSRKSKNRDDDRIFELSKEVKELKYEISDMANEIADALLGSDAGSFAEDMVKSMIDAFRKGEDYMQVFEDKFDSMVDNMIMKAIVSKVVSHYMDRLWASMDERISAKTSKAEEDYKRAAEERERIESMSVEDYFKQKGENGHVTHERAEELSKMYLAELEVAKNAEKAAREAITAASEIDKTDISALMEELAEIKPELGQKLKEIFGEYYKFGDAIDKDLSALQQGIQGVTEDTAGAIEAYMNGMSQQVYLQSTLLTQIRDAVVQFDIDVQVATMSQILLQLQASYQAQMVIQSTLQGWSSPNGMAVRVELNN